MGPFLAPLMSSHFQISEKQTDSYEYCRQWNMNMFYQFIEWLFYFWEGGVCRFTPGHGVAVIFLQAYMLPYKKLQTMKEMITENIPHLIISPSFSISLSFLSLSLPLTLSFTLSSSKMPNLIKISCSIYTHSSRVYWTADFNQIDDGPNYY